MSEVRQAANSASGPIGMGKLQHALDETSLWLVFALVGGAGASVLALGLLLRSGRTITTRLIAGTVLHSLVWGAIVFLLLVDQAGMSLPFMLGVSMSSGMGLASLIDLMLQMVRNRLGITVTLNPPPRAGGKEPPT